MAMMNIVYKLQHRKSSSKVHGELVDQEKVHIIIGAVSVYFPPDVLKRINPPNAIE